LENSKQFLIQDSRTGEKEIDSLNKRSQKTKYSKIANFNSTSLFFENDLHNLIEFTQYEEPEVVHLKTLKRRSTKHPITIPKMEKSKSNVNFLNIKMGGHSASAQFK
jgi:hypothetical protein